MSHWQNEAACYGSETSLFYERFEEKSINEKIDFINDTCNICPVKDICMQNAINNKEYGLHAGQWFKAGKPKNPLQLGRANVGKVW